MNEEQELAALEAELAALEVAAEAKVEEVKPEPVAEVIVEAPKPKKEKKAEPKAEQVKPAISPKEAAIRLYGAARLHAKQRSKGLR